MQKTLEQIQEENRRAIIMAVNPEAKSYEEALEMEYFGKIINIKPSEISISGINKFNGKPLTLDRIISALDQRQFDSVFKSGNKLIFDKINEDAEEEAEIYQELFKWDLTKPTLEEQTEDCQRQVHKLLMGE